MKATPEVIWEVLSDGWLYPLWVVGASRMREVDEHWPAPGARLHHSVGSWPVLIDDVTEVVAATPGVSLQLRVHARPGGTGVVTMRLEPSDGDTRVVMEEDMVAGPAARMPKALRDLALSWRNVESLRRLAYVVERRPARVSQPHV